MTKAIGSDYEHTWLICPYCGVRQSHALRRQIGPQVILCDCENVPGCDRYFSVMLAMKPVVEYFTMTETDEAKDQTAQRMAEARQEAS